MSIISTKIPASANSTNGNANPTSNPSIARPGVTGPPPIRLTRIPLITTENVSQFGIRRERTSLTPKEGDVKVSQSPAQFTADGKGIYFTTDKDSEFKRLVHMDLADGGLAGGAVAVVLAHRWGQVRTLGVTSVLFGLVDLVIFLYPLVLDAVWPALVGMVVVGLPAAFLSAAFQTVFQRSTEDATRGRAYSLVALARTFSTEQSPEFVNGLLGRIQQLKPTLLA